MASVAFLDDAKALDSIRVVSSLSDKGQALGRLGAELGLPTPAGFVFACNDGTQPEPGAVGVQLPAEAQENLRAAIAELGDRIAGEFGTGASPFFVSLRGSSSDLTAGAPAAVLNIGLNDLSVETLAASTDNRVFAFDSYQRLIHSYGRVARSIPQSLFAESLEVVFRTSGASSLSELDATAQEAVVKQFKQLVADTGAPFPQDPFEQIHDTIAGLNALSVAAARRIHRPRASHDGTVRPCFVVQRMVFGNRDASSGTGVASSRDTINGAMNPAGSFVFGGQGHDAGATDALSLEAFEARLPAVHQQLIAALETLEKSYRDVVEVEFTVEGGELFFLDVGAATRSGIAAVRLSVGLRDGDALGLTKEEALGLVTSDHLDQILHKQFASGENAVIAKGLGASPGAAVGRVYFSADRAVDAYDEGEDIILVATETSPEDVHGMAIAEGILTAKGGLASHAAVVARGWGKPAVCGAAGVTVSERSFEVDGHVVAEGDVVSLDGSSGFVYLGAVDMSESETPEEFETVLKWADEVRAGKLGVRANADAPDDAKKARQFGAEGIGLCRTEHQFLGKRLPLIQQFILASTAEEEAAALAELAVAQRSDFLALLKAMDGFPVTVRLLDPPLHEFLPSVDEMLVKQATDGLSAEEKALLAAASYWHEENPMLGVRGVRLGILRSGLYQMQVKALLDAVAACRSEGGTPKVEIMIPLIINERELDLASSWIAAEIAAAGPEAIGESSVTVGTMIETPRAAIQAGTIASHADFFSFGTNDLTQMTLGFSRDDIESKLMSVYIEEGLLDANPFESLDIEGVGALVRSAAAAAREANPRIKIGVCGEHGGDAASIAVFWAAGLDYVSCSPYRVPIARLAVAQAIIANPDRL